VNKLIQLVYVVYIMLTVTFYFGMRIVHTAYVADECSELTASLAIIRTDADS